MTNIDETASESFVIIVTALALLLLALHSLSTEFKVRNRTVHGTTATAPDRPDRQSLEHDQHPARVSGGKKKTHHGMCANLFRRKLTKQQTHDANE